MAAAHICAGPLGLFLIVQIGMLFARQCRGEVHQMLIVRLFTCIEPARQPLRINRRTR
ncbi:MAG TPA: hypothetical protein VM115_06440 [Vicinamibacterales bacterium]|nr:hypothetical protein [Vicinamibacterales bacterium]